MKCCICGKEFGGYGNNPYPVMESGKCCDECDINIVLPSRINALRIRRHLMTMEERDKLEVGDEVFVLVKGRFARVNISRIDYASDDEEWYFGGHKSLYITRSGKDICINELLVYKEDK